MPVEVVVKLNIPTVSESISVVAEPSAAQLETDSSKSHIDIDTS